MDEDLPLLRDIVAGGAAGARALDALFRKYRGPLLGHLRSRGIAASVAEDAVQETFVRVMRSAATFRGESRVSSWLYSIALHAALDGTQEGHREDQFSESGWDRLEDDGVLTLSEDPGRRVDQVAYRRCVEARFAEFARKHPKMADALVHVVHLGWSMRRLADLLGRTEEATRQYMVTVRKRVATCLAPCAELHRASGHE